MFITKSINPFSLARRINRPLILDGAMGSMLQKKGLKSKGSMWLSMANITDSDVVYGIHKEYISAGADIITTNTFRTNPEAVENFGSKLSINKLVNNSVRLALSAAKDLPVMIAGSNAPAEDCYQRERKLPLDKLKYNHHKHIELLMESGCHFILNETQSHLDEIKVICKYCSQKNIPYVISIFVDENLNLLSGENLFEATKIILDYSPLALSINCVKPGVFFKFYKKSNLNFNWGAYLNAGSGSFSDEKILTGITPEDYSAAIKKALKKSPSFVGGCCGTTPAHIRAIKKVIDGKN